MPHKHPDIAPGSNLEKGWSTHILPHPNNCKGEVNVYLTGANITLARERSAPTHNTKNNTHEPRSSSMSKDLCLPWIQSNAKSQKDQNQTGEKLNDQPVTGIHYTGVYMASAHGDLTASISTMQGKSRQCPTQCLTRYIEHHTWEGNDASEERC